MKRFESTEDYLEKILQISEVKEVHAIEIARETSFAKASICPSNLCTSPTIIVLLSLALVLTITLKLL